MNIRPRSVAAVALATARAAAVARAVAAALAATAAGVAGSGSGGDDSWKPPADSGGGGKGGGVGSGGGGDWGSWAGGGSEGGPGGVAQGHWKGYPRNRIPVDEIGIHDSNRCQSTNSQTPNAVAQAAAEAPEAAAEGGCSGGAPPCQDPWPSLDGADPRVADPPSAFDLSGLADSRGLNSGHGRPRPVDTDLAATAEQMEIASGAMKNEDPDPE